MRAPTSRRVNRAALARRIEESGEPLLLVVAPSGYGKTSLLAQWARSTRAAVAWLACEEADREPAHFWSRFADTLAARWPGVGSDSSLMVHRPSSSWTDHELVTALSRDLAEVPGAAAIVVDDSQLAEPSQRMLAALAQRLPPNVRLVMSSQHNPMFSTTRLRLEGVVTELRAADLAFTQSEVDDLLRAAGLDLGPDDRGRLWSLTEGWPAGLQLAVLALRKAPDPAEVIEAFASTTKETSDYLASEVIAGLNPELTEFMARISILDGFDAELCETVTGRRDARSLLELIVADDLFIYQLDYAGERFRFHQMFAAFLRTRLKAMGGEAFREAHERAVDALQGRGDRLGALRHAMAVADVRRAAAIVVDSMSRILEVDDAREAMAVAREWLARFGEAAAEPDPELVLQFVFLLATCGQREAQRWLVAVDRAHPSPEPGLDAFAHATWAQYHLNRGTVDLALVHNGLASRAAAVAASHGPQFPKLAELGLQEASAHLLVGDLAAAASALQQPAPLSSPIVDEVRSPALQHWVAFLQGDLTSARRLSNQFGRAGVAHDGVRHGVGPVIAALVAAGIHLERGEHESAADVLTAARRAAEIDGRPVVQSLVDLWLARLATARADPASALACLAQARLVLGAQTDRVRAHFACEEFRIAVALMPDEADALVPQLPGNTGSRLLQAQLAVHRGDWGSASAILRAVGPSTIRETLEWGLLSSLTEQNRDLTKAHAHLEAALRLARPHGYATTIVQSGAGIEDLLRSLPTVGALKEYVDELLRVAHTLRPPPTAMARQASTEVLTSREIDVLRLLSSRLTTNEIAQTLFVSPNTLKTHMKSIYHKLHVNSRSEAQRQSQRLGML